MKKHLYPFFWHFDDDRVCVYRNSRLRFVISKKEGSDVAFSFFAKMTRNLMYRQMLLYRSNLSL